MLKNVPHPCCNSELIYSMGSAGGARSSWEENRVAADLLGRSNSLMGKNKNELAHYNWMPIFLWKSIIAKWQTGFPPMFQAQL